MTKRSPPSTHMLNNGHRKLPQKQHPAGYLTWYIVTFVASVVAFFIGPHLHGWENRHRGSTASDEATVTAVAADSGTALVVETPDGKAVMIVSSVDDTIVGPLEQSLKQQRLKSIASIIVTSLSPDTADAITLVTTQFPLSGPIIIPSEQTSKVDDWSLTRHNFAAAMKERGLTVTAWNGRKADISNIFPSATVSVFSPAEVDEQIPLTGVRIDYGESSLLVLNSLTKLQTAALTDQPIGGACRLLVVKAQDTFVTKELLADLQPDIVLLADPQETPPGDETTNIIQMADAAPVSLTESAPVKLLLSPSAAVPVLVAK